MDSKNTTKDDVRLAIAALQEKIAFLQKKVDELCESSECFQILDSSPVKKDEKK